MDEMGRNRKNRAALLQAGRAMGRAFTVRELHDAALKDQPKLGLTTAYRAGDRWREEGFAEEAGRRGDEATFVFCTDVAHHHHVVCVDCGATTTLEGCVIEPVRRAVSAAGFQLIDEALGALPARCTVCAANAR